MPKLSIIVPVYNVKNFLSKCINSIRNQTFKDYELILIDDGSTDGSGELCDALAKQNDRTSIIHQENHGQAHARNIGIGRAKGEYIGFVDSDDWIEPEMFDRMIKMADNNDADIVICRVRKIERDGSVVEEVGPQRELCMNRIKATIEILKDEAIPSFPVNKIYRRSLFDGIKFPEGRIFEDTATIYKVFYKSSKVIAIPYMGYNYMQNPNGTCHKKYHDVVKHLNKELYNALAFDERYVFAREHEDLKEIVPLCAYKAYIMIRSFIHMLGHKRYKLTEEQKKIVNEIMDSFRAEDLSLCTRWERLDMYLFHYSKKILKTYINMVPYFHKMKD